MNFFPYPDLEIFALVAKTEVDVPRSGMYNKQFCPQQHSSHAGECQKKNEEGGQKLQAFNSWRVCSVTRNKSCRWGGLVQQVCFGIIGLLKIRAKKSLPWQQLCR